MANPQITAKLKLDSRDVKNGSIEVQREFATMGQRMRASLGGAMRGALRGGVAAIGTIMTATLTAAVTKGLRSGVSQALTMENTEVLLKSTLGDITQLREAMTMLGEEAEKNPMFSKEQLATAAAGLSTFAKGSAKELKGLLDTAKLLSVINPAQGLEGAAFALKEALGGDFVSLQSRFDISKAAVRDLKGQGLSGKELVDAVIRAQGITDQTLREMAGTRQAQLQGVMNQLTNIGEMFFDAIWPSLEPQLKGMQDWMKANGGEVVAGLKVIAQATAATAKAVGGTFGGFDKVTDFIADKTVGWNSPINAAIQGTAAMGHALREFSAGNMSVGAAAQYVNNSVVGAQLGARSRQAVASGQVKPAAALTINVTGSGVTPQMSNS